MHIGGSTPASDRMAEGIENTPLPTSSPEPTMAAKLSAPAAFR